MLNDYIFSNLLTVAHLILDKSTTPHSHPQRIILKLVIASSLSKDNSNKGLFFHNPDTNPLMPLLKKIVTCREIYQVSLPKY